MSEGPIWRPNSFTPDEWEKLSREKQLQSWKDRPSTGPSLHPLNAVRLYDKGVITHAEIRIFVFENLTDRNIHEFFADCPVDVMLQLQQSVSQLPADDDADGWAKMVRISGICYAPWVTPDEIRQDQAERDRRFREGVRLFRFALRNPTRIQ
jgi:hypothetical protein